MLGPEHPETLTSVNNLAELYRSQGRYGEAEPLYRRALEASERVLGPENPATLTTRGNLAVLLVRTGRPGAALRELRALDLRLGQWLETEVRTTQAAAMQRQALRLASVYQAAAFSLALAHPSEAGDAFAADLVLRWKKRLAQEDAVLNNLARESRDPALLETIGAVRQGRAALSNTAFDPSVSAERKADLLRALEAAEAELRTASAKFDRYQAVKSASAEEVQIVLPTASALVEYRFFDPYDFEASSFGPTRLLAVVLTPDRPAALVDLGEAEPIKALQAALTDAELRGDIPFDTLAQRAEARLVAPLRLHLGDARTLFLSPDGPLQALPFEALADPGGQRLVERFHVRMLQTGRDLVARDRPALGKGLVAVGGVDFGPRAGAAPETDVAAADAAAAAIAETRSQFGGFGALPESGAEASSIAETYAVFRPDEPAPVLLLGAEATEGALKGLAAPPRVLHLATHGYYLATGSVDGQPLLQSGVTLAGANRALAGGTGPDGENGVLHAIEAQTLNLYGTELVVLSACDTGRGAVDYSEGLEGLPRAFYVAGARNVLVALWPIGDLAARDFMQRFYEVWLAQPTSDPARALRQTKLGFITSANPADRDPAAWAPFVLFEG